MNANGSNEPREFELTPDNLLEIMQTWIPEQLNRMRLFEAGSIVVARYPGTTLECQYMQTIGGEKFRIVERTFRGDSGSDYHPPIGADDDVILAFAARVESVFAFQRKANAIRKTSEPISAAMHFLPGPFEA
jgi:hypothetical protein